MARFDVDPETNLADVALAVRDEWQGRGVGHALIDRLTKIARERGIAGFAADLLPNNGAMLALFRNPSFAVKKTLDSGVCSLTATFV